jgi:hypothetical protein
MILSRASDGTGRCPTAGRERASVALVARRRGHTRVYRRLAVVARDCTAGILRLADPTRAAVGVDTAVRCDADVARGRAGSRGARLASWRRCLAQADVIRRAVRVDEALVVRDQVAPGVGAGVGCASLGLRAMQYAGRESGTDAALRRVGQGSVGSRTIRCSALRRIRPRCFPSSILGPGVEDAVLRRSPASQKDGCCYRGEGDGSHGTAERAPIVPKPSPVEADVGHSRGAPQCTCGQRKLVPPAARHQGRSVPFALIVAHAQRSFSRQSDLEERHGSCGKQVSPCTALPSLPSCCSRRAVAPVPPTAAATTQASTGPTCARRRLRAACRRPTKAPRRVVLNPPSASTGNGNASAPRTVTVRSTTAAPSMVPTPSTAAAPSTAAPPSTAPRQATPPVIPRTMRSRRPTLPLPAARRPVRRRSSACIHVAVARRLPAMPRSTAARARQDSTPTQAAR